MSAKSLGQEAGYTLVEVMVAIMLLSIAIIPMISMFDAGLRASVVGSNYDKAQTLTNERLEVVRALPYNRPGEPADSAVEIYRPGTPFSGTSGIFSYTVTTTYYRETIEGIVPDTSNNSVVKPMMQVTVRVDWQGSHSYTTTGFVAAGAS